MTAVKDGAVEGPPSFEHFGSSLTIASGVLLDGMAGRGGSVEVAGLLCNHVCDVPLRGLTLIVRDTQYGGWRVEGAFLSSASILPEPKSDHGGCHISCQSLNRSCDLTAGTRSQSVSRCVQSTRTKDKGCQKRRRQNMSRTTISPYARMG